MTTATVTAAIGPLLDVPLTSQSDDELLDLLRQTETVRRQLEALDARLIGEAIQRNLAGQRSMRSPAALLAGLLNLSPREASRRVRHADQLAERVTITGEVLPPLLPATAAARAEGRLTAEHVSVIIRTIAKLPSTLPVEDISSAEQFLVDQARTFDAATLNNIARQLIDTLDPDGSLADDKEQQRRRNLSLTPFGNGMHRIIGDLDPETAAMTKAVIESLSAPKPEGDSGERDDRTAGQRRHDALSSVMAMALRAGELPRTGGVPATVVLHMTADQFETKTGLAGTSFGQKLTATQALRLADEASITWVVHNSSGGIVNHGRTQRLATEAQTLALIGRDRGCAFPGCPDPPEWSEKHHIKPWREGGTTDLNNLVLLCRPHHRIIDTHGWTITVEDGVPWFIPPTWIDPAQKPQRNIRP
ncbi:MAG: DUF222 domain-containing protein [Jatrophihabitantaceae bacterium]